MYSKGTLSKLREEYIKLDVFSAKAERGLLPVSERERETERETERDSLIYTGTVMTVNMHSPEKMSFLFFFS